MLSINSPAWRVLLCILRWHLLCSNLRSVSGAQRSVIRGRISTRKERKPRAESVRLEKKPNNVRRDHALLHKIFNASFDQISVVRRSDGRFVYVNDEFLKRGYTRKEVLGKTVSELHLWADEQELGRMRQVLTEQGYVRNLEAEVRMKDGRVVPYLISSNIVTLNGEQCVVSVGREITELKKIQNELTTTVARLTETERRLKAQIAVDERVVAERNETEQ